jgi:hypothetical protein
VSKVGGMILSAFYAWAGRSVDYYCRLFFKNGGWVGGAGGGGGESILHIIYKGIQMCMLSRVSYPDSLISDPAF